MPKIQHNFRLSDAVVEAIDDLAASTGDKSKAVSESLLYWRAALEQAGRRNFDEFSPEDCQREHRQGIDPEYQPHIYHQSKHGIQQRAPLSAVEIFAATVQAEDRKEAAK